MPKGHKEFHTVDMESASWRSPPGYPEDIQQKILAGGLDETNKTGNRTRLLRFAPGAFTTEPFVHDYWEEVYLISGDLVVGDGKTARLRRASVRTPTPAGRPESAMGHSDRVRGVCCSSFITTKSLRDEDYGAQSAPLRHCEFRTGLRPVPLNE